MSRTYSQMIELGTTAPAFDLPAANPDADGLAGDRRSLLAYAGAPVLVVMFTCNHCPYAQHVEEQVIDIAREYSTRGVRFVAINANDPDAYPDDSFENMARRARERRYPYAYLFDASQSTARSYGALCTPDLFVYNSERKLVYRGRVDETRPGMGEAHGADLRHALGVILETGFGPRDQWPSMGCNIKWKPGNEPQL